MTGHTLASLAGQYLRRSGYGKETIGCQATVRTDEHRNEVIAAKCTVTALPFTKRFSSRVLHPPSYSRRFRKHNPLIEIPWGDDSRGRELFSRPPESAVGDWLDGWRFHDAAFFASNGGRVHGKHLQTANNGSASRHKGRTLFVSVGRNETQIREEDDVPPARARDKNLDSTCARRISKCLEFIKTFMIPEGRATRAMFLTLTTPLRQGICSPPRI